MLLAVKATRISRDDLEALPGKVNAEGGDLRVLSGSDHGLSISVMASVVMPGNDRDGTGIHMPRSLS